MVTLKNLFYMTTGHSDGEARYQPVAWRLNF